MITKRNAWILTAVTLLAGIILGLGIASNLNWTKSGIARETPVLLDSSKKGETGARIGADKLSVASRLDLNNTGKAFVEVAQQVMP
ncbi:MAG: hypothetical protein ACRENG_27920, partial [bacterium]